jgi:hypothetical protein
MGNNNMKLLFGLILTIGILRCSDSDLDYTPADCTLEATVVDHTGTDGCGLMLQLNDGKLLAPLRLTYVQPPKPEEDPIYHYQLQAGEKVIIGYTNTDQQVSACMMGETIVFITCIRSADEK